MDIIGTTTEEMTHECQADLIGIVDVNNKKLLGRLSTSSQVPSLQF